MMSYLLMDTDMPGYDIRTVDSMQLAITNLMSKVVSSDI